MIMLAERDWWGRDAAVEVRARLMNHFFRHAPVDRFLGYVRERNIRSIFIYRRLGYAFTGLMQRPVRDPASGRMADLMRFEIERQQWLAGPFGGDDR
jgi:RimJ/RimL family protein N-acetyltransferase